MNRRSALLSAGLGVFLFTACGDDDTNDHDHDGSVEESMDGGRDASTDASTGMDATTGNDASAADASADAGDAGDASTEPAYEPPEPTALELSAGGPDQLQSAVAGPDGSFYAAGFMAETPAGARTVIVVKGSPDGLDEDFGDQGVAVTPLEFRGGNDEIDVAVQPSGKILVSATVANTGNAMDRDIAIVRLNDDGTVDNSFGGSNNGVRVIDLNSAADSTAMPGMLTAFDGVRSIAVDDDGNIYVHAMQRGTGDAAAGGPRQDTDFTVLKLSADGVPDATFAGTGKFLLDFEESNATPRGLYLLDDGNLLATGYANTPAIGSVQVVLYKLTPAGTLVEEFAIEGVYNAAVLTAQTEAYGAAIHGDHFVTGGYGREGGDRNEWVALRFDSETGERDGEFGGTDNGAVLVDPSGGTLGNNCHGAVALPGGKTLLIGSTGAANMPERDAAFAVLDGDGLLDEEAYGEAVFTFPFREQGADAFWGAAVSGDHALLVGYSGAGMTQTEELNDDAYVLFLPLE